MTEIFDDIKKLYEFRRPCKELEDYIEFFSESSSSATKEYTGHQNFSVKMFPSWTPTLWINLGPSYYLSLGDKRYYIPSGHGIVINRDSMAERTNKPADYLFTIKFYPGGLEKVIGINQSGLAGKLIPAKDLLPSFLICNAKQLDSFEERIKLFEDFFLQQMIKNTKKDHYIQLVTQTIATYTSSGMRYNVNELSGRLFASSKTISRYFKATIGITPKVYFESIRARAALVAYLHNTGIFNPADYGYYDMSHFYKGIKNFTGNRLAEHLG